MKVTDALAMAREQIDEPREVEMLLGHLLAQDRVGVYLRKEQVLGSEELLRLESMVRQRVAGVPLQYIIGMQSFRGLEIEVGPGVLVPRPETEQVVESALEVIAEVDAPIVFDVCTGSGAIALSIAAQRPDALVLGSDISEDALVFAHRNGQGSRVEFLHGDLFSPFPTDLRGRVDLVISNPPYLSEQEWVEAPFDVRVHEPRLATVAGPDGSEVLHRIINHTWEWLSTDGWLVLELAPSRVEAVTESMLGRYDNFSIRRDLAGMDRIVLGQKS